jgi:hypothetical protein
VSIVNDKSRSGAKSNPGWLPKGRSGNPGGRPTTSPASQGSALDVLLEKTLTVTQHGATREITVEEALRQRTYRDAVGGERMAQREVAKWIMKCDDWLAKHKPSRRTIQLLSSSSDPDNADAALSCFWGSRRQIPRARTSAPTGPNSSFSLGRFRPLSAAGEAAIA